MEQKPSSTKWPPFAAAVAHKTSRTVMGRTGKPGLKGEQAAGKKIPNRLIYKQMGIFFQGFSKIIPLTRP